MHMFKSLIYPFAKRYALNFLNEKNPVEKQDKLFQGKLKKQSKSVIGRKLGITNNSKIKDIPLTKYEFYRPFFENPKNGDFIYPLNDYVKATTSGTMGKPKTFMTPRKGLWDNLQKTGFSVMLISTHDGEKVTFDIGDTVYRNAPGGSHISAFLTDLFEDRNSGWVEQCPDIDLPFNEKVDYFVKHYPEINVAYMTISTLLDDIAPRIDEEFYLKGFMSQDRSAEILKEDIKKLTGNYPKTTYGSTETLFCSIPSIQFPGSFLFDWRVMYSEFIYEDDKVDTLGTLGPSGLDLMNIDHVKVGGHYQLIATPFQTDMTRYVMPDIFECVAERDDILETEFPVFKYYSRADRILVLHNFTRIAEDELLEVFKAAEVPFVEFTARRELDGSRDYLHLYIELRKPVEMDALHVKINSLLGEYDRDWRDLSDFLGYDPLKITVLPKGSFKRYLSRQKGMPKVERIIMKEERFKNLISSAG